MLLRYLCRADAATPLFSPRFLHISLMTFFATPAFICFLLRFSATVIATLILMFRRHA